MIVRVVIAGEGGPSNYLIDTDSLRDGPEKDAILFVANGGREGTFGDYGVCGGEIYQDGYGINNTIDNSNCEIEDPVRVVAVSTSW